VGLSALSNRTQPGRLTVQANASVTARVTDEAADTLVLRLHVTNGKD